VALPATRSSIVEHAVLDGADARRFPFLPHPFERTSTPVPCPPTSFVGTVVAADSPLTRA
jgi:hypothetical protein